MRGLRETRTDCPSDEGTENAREALELYVEGLRDEGRPLDTGVVRRKLPLPA